MEKKGIKNAIIVMDNALYHKTMPVNTIKPSHRKDVLIAKCQELNVPINLSTNPTKSQIWDALAPHLTSKPITCTLAEEAGHDIVYSPPYHPDLQPIENLWASVKGKVAYQYHHDRGFQEVHEQLVKAFEGLTSEEVGKTIAHSTKLLRDFWKKKMLPR